MVQGVEVVAEDRDSVTDAGVAQAASDARAEAAVSVIETVPEGAQVDSVGVAGAQAVSDRAEIVMGDHRHQVREVMSVAITSEGQVAVEAAPDTAQARADHMTVQEAHKAADSKLKDFSDYI